MITIDADDKREKLEVLAHLEAENRCEQMLNTAQRQQQLFADKGRIKKDVTVPCRSKMAYWYHSEVSGDEE